MGLGLDQTFNNIELALSEKLYGVTEKFAAKSNMKRNQ
jgi:hypothetical protein